MWIEIQKDDLVNLKKFADVVKTFFASDEYYEQLSEVWLNDQMKAKPTQKNFIYDDGVKQMVFGTKYSSEYPNPLTQTKGMQRIVDLAYTGDWGGIDANNVSQEALIFGIDAVHKFLDDNGIKTWYVVMNKDTQRLEILKPELVPQATIFLQFLSDIQEACKDEIMNTIPLDKNHFELQFQRKV